MLQPKKLIQLPLFGAILLGLIAVLFFVGRKRSSKPDPDAKVHTHTVEKSPDEVRKYWTDDKMRKVKPAPMPSTNDLKPGKEHPRHPSV
ncbi:MAG: hypothetical protein ACRDHZ_11160 [Ktedonobacteraceae bacterium]